MVVIYTKKTTARLSYILTHIFRNILGTEFSLTENKETFLRQAEIRINYSDMPIDGCIQIIPYDLLFETGIRSITELHISEWNDLFCFFANNNPDIPFDLFAASFYLISRYEEYHSSPKDTHQRYDIKNSILFQNNCMEIPLVDRWAYRFMHMLSEKGYDISGFKLRKYQAINTFDIDFPFEFRNKGLALNVAGAIKDLLNKKISQFPERIKTMLHFQEDPYFKAIQEIEKFQYHSNKPYYLFVLLGKNERYGKKYFYSLKRYFRYLSGLRLPTIGIHPSYSASFDKDKMLLEKMQLERILNKKVCSNRQHYLRMQIPETYQSLEEIGIKEDFTLIYPDCPGFRAGTAVPFHFYDLTNEVSTSLLIRPTIIMDTTLISQMKVSPEEMLEKIKTLAETCLSTGGDFIMLWHNSNISGDPKKNPWINIFIEGSNYAFSLEN